MNSQESLNKRGCVLVKNLFDKTTIGVISKYLENKIIRGEWKPAKEENYKYSRFGYYADPLIEVLLRDSKEVFEEITRLELLPTYSYVRVYQPGEQLNAHLDREACEITVTVNVACVGDASPIYTKYQDQEPEEHVLNPGDAIVYRGCDVLHWRSPLKEGQLNVQFMLHYVDKNGPNANCEKDNRVSYGLMRT
jgi:hypothetical protein